MKLIGRRLSARETDTQKYVRKAERDTLLLILDFLAFLCGFLLLRSLPSLRPSVPPISYHHTLIFCMPSHPITLSLSLSLYTLTSRPLTLSLKHTLTRPVSDEGVILLNAET